MADPADVTLSAHTTAAAASTVQAAPTGFAAVVPPLDTPPPVVDAVPAAPAAVQAPTGPKLPTQVTMTEMYGFWTEASPSELRLWKAGAVVTVAADIADLKMRGAPCQDSGTL